ISGDRLHALADDPDDLTRQLQQLAAAAGGNPSNTVIAVDGFQDGSKLPPKSTIAYIKVNPDLFSAEYREPPFGGGRVEVYTKPGQSAYHGALFATNGSPWMNARDPFSTSKASLGKQRYGFELTGPIRKKGSDFVLALEHRSIDNFAVVNAFTLDSTGSPVRTVGNVATPQRLWIGSAKIDWQLGPKNTFIASYNANVNHLQNQGAGGTSLAETGYDSQQSEHMLRFSNITTASVHLMHEARVSLRWNGETDTPASNAVAVQVAGAFTGGGNTLGPQHRRELNMEILDDAILTTKNHTLKMGTQLMIYRERQQLTTNFNGTYTFGGGSAPVLSAGGSAVAGQTTTISGLEQYRRALLGLPGGTPTAYSNVAGSPVVNFTLVQDALFIQDDWNIGHGVHVASGVRYYLQNNPDTFSSITPRIGILWSPNAKGTWTLHGHFGMFAGRYNKGDQSEVQRMNGIGPANLNIFEMQNSGQGRANVVFIGVDQHSYKKVQFSFGGVRVNLLDDTDDNEFSSPQSSRTNAGELARRTSQPLWNVFANGTLKLPEKLELSSTFNGHGGSHYNITTGFDNNGDGNFNDRPQYASAGTPGAVSTQWGWLVASGGTGAFQRNAGTLPWTLYLDTNLQRAFKLTHNAKAEHPQTLTLNVRSANMINHKNVTSVGGVLGSPLFGVPYAADNGRRVEAGLRYAF
ncbi:hypothetical protein AB4043_21310, partial [Terriglobus sp. YAF25]|uniref:TonB-dependent receptor n=1 Tax=Terriglobus sp. YAF25 TaxID=3233080 RepID=UPI003F9E8191